MWLRELDSKIWMLVFIFFFLFLAGDGHTATVLHKHLP